MILLRHIAGRWVVCLALALAAVAVYAPGLHSDFLLDDYQNLKNLSALGSDARLSDLLSYSLTDVSGPFGRPIALFSFAIQYQAWPNDPTAFKAVNLIIHLATGGMLLGLFGCLARISGLSRTAAFSAAVVGSALWLLAPLHVSTVLYTVQRMTQLAAFFSVVGIWAWVQGRQRLAESCAVGWVWLTGGVGLSMVLALLSKETGVLIPLYILVLEATLLRALPAPQALTLLRSRWVWVPLLAGSCAAVWHYSDWLLAGYASRDFTLAERLLTEPRVLMRYVRMALFADPAGLGLFQDDFQVSRTWSDPATTVPAIVLLGAAAVGSWALRRRFPVPAFGVLWFLAGHILESTLIPLELSFDHRNYLPIAGIYFSVGYLLVRWFLHSQASGGFRPAMLVAAGWIAFFAWITWNECRLWGEPYLQATIWAKRHPDSIRAQEHLASAYAERRDYGRASAAFRRLANMGYPAAYLSLWNVRCYDPDTELPPLATVVDALSRAGYSNAPILALEQLVILREEGRCEQFAKTGAPLAAFKVLEENPRFASRLDALHFFEGRWRLADGDLPGAIEAFTMAYARHPSLDTAIVLTRLGVVAKDESLARSFLTKAKFLAGKRLLSDRVAKDLHDIDSAVVMTFPR